MHSPTPLDPGADDRAGQPEQPDEGTFAPSRDTAERSPSLADRIRALASRLWAAIDERRPEPPSSPDRW